MNPRITLVILLAAPAIFCSEVPSITVNASGFAKTTPTGLQVWVTIKDKGADVAAAGEALKASKEKVAAKLAALGVKPEDVKGELPAVVDPAAAEAVRARRTGGRLKRKTTPEEKPEVEMQQSLRAVIPLTAKDRDAVFIEAEGLKAKVKAAKLVEEKADAAEGEEDDNMGRYYDGQKPEAVMFAFFAPHNEELQAKALADALKKATESATRAAKAMGKGEVVLHSVVVGADGDQSSQAQYQQYRYNYNGYNRGQETPTSSDGNVSYTPEMMVYAQVSAVFRFK